MSDILEPDDDGSGHAFYENAGVIGCSCGWSSEVTDEKYLEPIKIRHLRLVGVISDEELDEMDYDTVRDFDGEYKAEDAPNRIEDFTDEEE